MGFLAASHYCVSYNNAIIGAFYVHKQIFPSGLVITSEGDKKSYVLSGVTQRNFLSIGLTLT